MQWRIWFWVLGLVAGCGGIDASAIPVRLGVGGTWGITPVAFSFIGGAGRLELASKVFGVLAEVTALADIRADDWALYLDGVVVFYISNSYVGVGGGWARWEDTAGRDRGVWTQTYLKLLVGQEFSLLSLPAYIQVNIILGQWSWLQPAVTAGIWLK